MASVLLRVTLPNGVCLLRLNRSAARNALSFELLQALQSELASLRLDNCTNVRAVVIAGAGPAFCSGHDLKELLALRGDPKARADIFDLCSEVMQAVVTLPQPTIACVDGIATAAGLQLVASCDLAVASKESKFSTPGVKIGLFCSTPGVALARVANRRLAMDMLLTGRTIDSAEAKAGGIISHIAGEGRTPLDVAEELAGLIAASAGDTLRIGKSTFHRQTELQLKDAYAIAGMAMAENLGRRNACTGIESFLQKKQPQWLIE